MSFKEFVVEIDVTRFHSEIFPKSSLTLIKTIGSKAMPLTDLKTFQERSWKNFICNMYMMYNIDVFKHFQSYPETQLFTRTHNNHCFSHFWKNPEHQIYRQVSVAQIILLFSHFRKNIENQISKQVYFSDFFRTYLETSRSKIYMQELQIRNTNANITVYQLSLN